MEPTYWVWVVKATGIKLVVSGDVVDEVWAANYDDAAMALIGALDDSENAPDDVTASICRTSKGDSAIVDAGLEPSDYTSTDAK